MATSPESGLNPARGDDGGAVLCALEFVAGGDVEFVEVCRTEVGQRMTLEPSPQEFDGVQVRRVRRQVLSEAVKKGGTYVARAMKRDACRSTENSARLDRRARDSGGQPGPARGRGHPRGSSAFAGPCTCGVRRCD